MTADPKPSAKTLRNDVLAALIITLLSIPQGVAYAIIAGLPPAAGLYAAALPVIVGSLLRSSRHVISGPTNALSLLVGGTVATIGAQQGADPMAIAVTLALLVGVFQVAGGVLKLGAVTDYISTPVVLGYISGAGVLIGVGQLHHITGTERGEGRLLGTVLGWLEGLSHTDWLPLVVGLSTTVLLMVLRLIDKRIPGAVVVMVLGIVASMVFDLPGRGLSTVADLSPIEAALPPFTLPSLGLVEILVPAAIAAMVLSLVESNAVARSIAGHTGDRIDANREFVGQGLANLTAAFFGGYPVSGSLSRSTVCWKAGGETRLAGMLSGGMVVAAVLLAGPIINYTPIASLAGLLLVVAADLIEPRRIAQTLRSGPGDAAAFVVTVLGTWVLPLDQAIYLGVAISIALFLRRARLLVVHELGVDQHGRLREIDPDVGTAGYRRCRHIRILHVEGRLFFGAAGELRDALDELTTEPDVQVYILRLKRTSGFDATVAEVLTQRAEHLHERGKQLLLVGMRPDTMRRIERSILVDEVEGQDLFPTKPGWFQAMDEALRRALEEVTKEHDEDCPISEYLALRDKRAEERDAG